jgi:hypothetical protein
MKTIVRLCLLAAAAAALRAALWAVEPPAEPRTHGKVLVLESGRTFEGDIERHGDQYRIHRGAGEVWLPAEPTMRLCADWQDAFAFMTSRANLLDADERLRLARWCQVHGLYAQALSEVIAATRMQPGNKDALQMKVCLERTVAMGAAKRTDLNPLPGSAVPSLDISSESVALFTTKVQPILMNTCVSCHAAGKDRHFELFRAFEGGQRAATQKNLAAVLVQIDVKDPELSPLLIKAVSPHAGMGQPPLKDKKALPYQTLEYWVHHLLTNNPHLRAAERSGVKQASYPTPQPRPVPLVDSPRLPGATIETRPIPHMEDQTKVAGEPREVPRSATASTPAVPRDILPPPPPAPAAAVAGEAKGENGEKGPAPAPPVASPESSTLPESSFSEQSKPRAAAEAGDEFDPAIFNRQVHPGK